MKFRQTISAVVIVLYLIVTSAIGLFHNEGCVLGAEHAGTTNVLSCNEPCPACMFSAGFNSTKADYGLLPICAKSPVICQAVQHFTVVDHDEWAYSILLRAPPLTSTS